MLDQLNSGSVWLFVFIVLPGFLSMRVYGLLRPMERITLKDNILEAIAFSIVNAALMMWAIRLLIAPAFFDQYPVWSYILFVATFLIAPTLWPFLLVGLISFLENKNIILSQQPTSWDHFFRRRQGRQGCWIVVHLRDGRRLGGKFGRNSYASAYPTPGHLYIEQLWRLDEDGRFLQGYHDPWVWC
jgi:hypothetical protein